MKYQSKYLMILIIILIGLIAIFRAKSILFNTLSIDEKNKTIADEINKNCPFIIDSETRLDNTSALPNNVFAYFYTLVNMQKDEIDTLNFKNAIKPTLIHSIKSHPDMKFQRKNQTTLSYNYRDRNGDFVLKLNIGPNDYK
jgi:hypothetical protein